MQTNNSTKEMKSTKAPKRAVSSRALASAVLDILECDTTPTLLHCAVTAEVEKLGKGFNDYDRNNVDQLAKDLSDRYKAEIDQFHRHNESETNYEFNIVLEADSMAVLKADAAAAYRTIEQQVEAIVVSYLGTENVLVDPAKIKAMWQTESLTINPHPDIPETWQQRPLLPDQEKMRLEFDRSSVMQVDEMRQLVKSLLSESCYEPKSLYGLIFLFSSFERLANAYCDNEIIDICGDIIRDLYRETANVDAGTARLVRILPAMYRSADFSKTSEVEVTRQFLYAEQVAPMMDAHGQPFDAEISSNIPSNLTIGDAAQLLDSALSSCRLPEPVYTAIMGKLLEYDDRPDDDNEPCAQWIERMLIKAQETEAARKAA